MTQDNYLYPITTSNLENYRLASLCHENVFYFYLSYPPRSTMVSQADCYDLPPPPPRPPELRRTPGHTSYHFTTPYYVMEQGVTKKVLCKAVPSTTPECSYYNVYYLSTSAPPEVKLFETPGRWIECSWILYPNGEIHYFVKKSLIRFQDSKYHYINTLHDQHNIIRAVLPQLVFAVIKLKVMLYRVRNKIRIRLFILNTHYKSSSPLRMLHGTHWGQVKKNIYEYITY